MSRFRPALIGGVVIGLLSSIPIVSIGNVCCCLWVVLGGLLTTYLDQQRRPEPIETADAVLGGLVAGLIGSVISCAISAAIFAATGALVQESIRNAIEGNSQIPPEWRDRPVVSRPRVETASREMVRRREAQYQRKLSRSSGRGRPRRQDRISLGRRAGRSPHAHLPRAARGRVPVRQCSQKSWRSQGRSR